MKKPYIVQVMQDIQDITSLANEFFKDEKSTTIWLNTENPSLGFKEPIEMIYKGDAETLKTFMLRAFERTVH